VTNPWEDSLGILLGERGKARELGNCIVVYDRAKSTNDLAQSLANKKAPHGTVIMAAEQLEGRGRWQRRWCSPKGGLYLSVILRPRVGGEPHVSLLPFATTVAASEAIAESCGISTRIRWPNDLIVNDKKLGGVLCNGSYIGEKLQYVVAGIGLNVSQTEQEFPSDLRGFATSLFIEGNRTFDLLPLAASVVERMEIGWERCNRQPEVVTKRWRELAVGETGSKVHVQLLDGEEFPATTAGLTDDGGLRVRDERGEVRVLHAEAIVRVLFL
jgi:BirA family biotin operon repressor/biotin-[acetyl-CoA-carboxylase] ligase